MGSFPGLEVGDIRLCRPVRRWKVILIEVLRFPVVPAWRVLAAEELLEGEVFTLIRHGMKLGQGHRELRFDELLPKVDEHTHPTADLDNVGEQDDIECMEVLPPIVLLTIRTCCRLQDRQLFDECAHLREIEVTVPGDALRVVRHREAEQFMDDLDIRAGDHDPEKNPPIRRPARQSSMPIRRPTDRDPWDREGSRR